MLNWYSFVKYQPNCITFGWEENIMNIAYKLISTILCDWHYLVACQHNSWRNFILRQHRKRTILFLQGSVETRNRCCGQYMHCFVGNYSAVSLPKIMKFGWDVTKLYQFNVKHGNVQFFGPPCISEVCNKYLRFGSETARFPRYSQHKTCHVFQCNHAVKNGCCKDW